MRSVHSGDDVKDDEVIDRRHLDLLGKQSAEPPVAAEHSRPHAAKAQLRKHRLRVDHVHVTPEHESRRLLEAQRGGCLVITIRIRSDGNFHDVDDAR